MYVISKWLLLLLLINEKLLEIKDNWLAEVRMLVVFFSSNVCVCVCPRLKKKKKKKWKKYGSSSSSSSSSNCCCCCKVEFDWACIFFFRCCVIVYCFYCWLSEISDFVR